MQRPVSSVAITNSAILIRIPRLYRAGMSEVALYDATRGIWKIGDRRDNAKIALAVVNGLVVEAYEIHQWHRAGTTAYASGRKIDLAQASGRWEFTGKVASAGTREKYLQRSVTEYFRKGPANPIRYVNI